MVSGERTVGELVSNFANFDRRKMCGAVGIKNHPFITLGTLANVAA
jgi:hypothetical protein